jgi:hypothetical protein
MPDSRPGSPEARAQGCLCSPGANHDGAGIRNPDTGEIYWLVDVECPLHGYGAAGDGSGMRLHGSGA